MNGLKPNGITLTLLVWIDNGQFVLASGLIYICGYSIFDSLLDVYGEVK
jgi:hypothetical protein